MKHTDFVSFSCRHYTLYLLDLKYAQNTCAVVESQRVVYRWLFFYENKIGEKR